MRVLWERFGWISPIFLKRCVMHARATGDVLLFFYNNCMRILWERFDRILPIFLKSYFPRRRPGQASLWGHRPSFSAPCAVPMRLSRIGQHIKDEPCAKQRALLGVFSSRCSSISRGVRSAGPIFTFSPLVPFGSSCRSRRLEAI
jgi:hypothetical protein